jgi:hypothetical protein
VRTKVRIVIAMVRLGLSKDDSINTIVSKKRKAKINSKAIKMALIDACHEIGDDALGSVASLMTTHGIRAGGALLMMLMGVALVEIMMRGRWKSTAVFSYLSAYVMDRRPGYVTLTLRLGRQHNGSDGW